MKKTVTLLLLVNAISIFSQELTLDLDNTIQRALEKDKSIKSAELSVDNATLDKKQAFKSGLPSVSYYLATTPDSEYSQGYLTLNQKIFDGGKTFIAIKNSNKYLEASQYGLEGTKNSVGISVTNQYISILKYQKQLEVLKNSKKELENNYKRINRLYELNLITKTEVLDLNYSLIELDSSVVQIENALEIAKLNLKNTIGISKNDTVNLQEINDLSIDIDSIDFDKDLREAKEKSISAKSAKVATELKKALEGTSRAELMPSVEFMLRHGNITQADGGVSNVFKNENVDTLSTISISGTLFDWGSNYDAYKQTKNNTKIAQEDEKEAQDSIEVNLRTSYLELLRLSKLKESKEKALESSSENFRYQKQRYEEQLINSTDFLNAENSLRESEIGLVNAELDLYYQYKNYLTLLK
ncbi:MAG: TolC family protein [Fusobacteriaceae bacterium]|nr:TolC family protein [Fusobacteriaceae bacterium]MBP6468201.1 TolC family protein [Fusobacteriaceae bacterium]MBP9595730.1 TolC family protein [Fusobacteriaceae bacterium]MBU9918174.1 TolC family protein [Fusobacteriaceae bacterium]